ncbi:Elongator complex protein 6 [Ceratocystis lukuohia]|uniref:Elongator complex protein 6 n=1 Tax=Ceratocystis lukuohia TaxID=2019550 RepID=A0ABR4MIB9_9PEZI
MASRAIPYLLTPYLSLSDESSLTLLTNVLSATSNWLVVRYLQSLLPARGKANDDADASDGCAAVVLVSFMRDFAFWSECSGKLGVDLSRHCREGNFVFVDGLTSLFASSTNPNSPPTMPATKGRVTLTSSKLTDIQGEIQAAVASLAGPGKNIVLIIDQIDFLLAATEGSATELQNALLSLRENVHSTILTVAADSALIAEQNTALERNHAGLALDLAHQADTVISLRMLDTGVARDVSGVMRITRGGQDHDERNTEEHEYLYYVSGDGGVRVFERGQ